MVLNKDNFYPLTSRLFLPYFLKNGNTIPTEKMVYIKNKVENNNKRWIFTGPFYRVQPYEYHEKALFVYTTHLPLFSRH